MPLTAATAELASWPYPFWIAHRGAGKLAPENTLAAFREGAARGFQMFECDVKLAGDDVAFLLHDDELDRTTCGRGNALTQPWSTLARLDAGSWHSSRYAGEPPPSLEAIARFTQANHCGVNLEIKPPPHHEARTGQLVAEAAARLWSGHGLAPLLSSFSVTALRAAATAVPALPRALLLDQLWSGWRDTAQALACCAVVAHCRLMDAALVRELNAHGWHALVYTVNDPEVAQRMIAAGVAGIITDELGHFAPTAPTASRG